MTLRVRGNLEAVEWGYCEYCRREVELLPRAYLKGHTTHQGEGLAEVTCKGSLRRPTKPPQEGADNAR